MKAQDVAMTPACEECGAVWLPADERRWQAHRIDDPRDEHAEPALGFFCPTCAEREFA
ncbi:MAG TPA: hypothetical protein VLB86_02380 [Gaiellaceae bacterium]|nr:hypothetical protein [Gaiellaceae bacterium]